MAKIIKDASPSDLPVQQATQFELIINLRARVGARCRDPPRLVVRADEVIQ